MAGCYSKQNWLEQEVCGAPSLQEAQCDLYHKESKHINKKQRAEVSEDLDKLTLDRTPGGNVEPCSTVVENSVCLRKLREFL